MKHHLTAHEPWLTLAIAGLLAIAAVAPGAAQAAGGEIFVADPSADAVFRVDPETGAQATVISAPDVTDPSTVALDANGDLLVLDTAPPKRVLRVDPGSGTATPISSGGLFSFPFDLVVEQTGQILVADRSIPAGSPGGIIRIDPETGAQSLLSTGGAFGCPGGIALEADGEILTVTGPACGGIGNAVVRVDATSGAQTVVSTGGLFVEANYLAVEQDGDILVTDGGAGQAIRRVDPETGAQSTLSSGGLFTASGFGISDIDLEENGDIVVAHHAANTVFRVDPETGAQSVVSSGGMFVDPQGIAVGGSTQYDFSGFLSPVDNPPTQNAVKAGRAVPVKFSLGGDQGLDIFAAGFPQSHEIDCDSSDPIDGIESTVTAGASGLSYDPDTDRYTYVWKTSKSWAGSCRRLVVGLNDGTEQVADFRLR